jgi:hypothetical protein
MRYKPKSTAALHIALGGLPDKMRVEADKNLGVTAHTVGELQKVAAWPENLVITTPEERHPESAVKVSKASVAPVRRLPREPPGRFVLIPMNLVTGVPTASIVKLSGPRGGSDPLWK